MERRISGHTKLYGLIGSPVGHSGSPAMYNYSFEKLGIDAAYLAFDVPLEKTEDALNALRTLNAGGFNVTMPCKTAVAQLVDRLSPAAVCGEIKRNRPCKTVVSKTTMYRYIAQGLFMGIRSEHLPVGQRKKQYRKTVAKRPPKGTSIERRPVDILSRNDFGHWEMDCVVGRQNTRNVLLVLTERQTRYEIIMKMPNRKAATVVQCLDRLERRHGKRFSLLFKTITVDNGSEFADFAGLERSVYGGKRTAVYYCHPYTSCERGSNERINRDIRRQFPKGTDFSKVSERRVQEVARWVNAYPRELFGFATSAEAFATAVASL